MKRHVGSIPPRTGHSCERGRRKGENEEGAGGHVGNALPPMSEEVPLVVITGTTLFLVVKTLGGVMPSALLFVRAVHWHGGGYGGGARW